MSTYCCHVYNILNADTSISQVSVHPMDVTALAGTANVRLTCSIQLTNDIGPDDSALSVSWSSPASTEDGSVPPTPMTQKKIKSTLNIPLIMKGQYCCNASLTGKSTMVSACANVEILSNLSICSLLCIACYDVDIDVSDPFQSLTLGSTAMITCSVGDLPTTAFKWLFQNGSVVNSSNVLTLQLVDYTHNGRVFTCSVNSSQLYSPGQKNFTITVKGIMLIQILDEYFCIKI